MRKSKLNRQSRLRAKVERLTPTQRAERRRLKRKHGPSGVRRRERRAHLQPKPVVVGEGGDVE